MRAARQLPGGEPTAVDDAPATCMLHLNFDDDENEYANKITFV